MSKINEQGSFEGRRAIVTGAARGIGFAIASRLHERGASVMIADINGDGASEACERIDASSPRLCSFAVDIADTEQIDATVKAAEERWGGLDILINNAAHARFGTVLEMPPEDLDYSYAVGLRGNFFCLQSAARAMAAGDGGKIVNVSSMTVPLGHARNVAYSAMKGAIEVITRVAAVELAPHNIQVNAIAPGPIDTELSRAVLTERGRADRLRHLPGGRFGLPDDIAGAALFLASAEAEWVTGSILAVDGGYTATGVFEH
ncbi:MAG TPA: SDR family oxidoreductase [Solirubrobacteraceae bacterium]|jgi:3-oxoacyl-[acyl-carrier protein] reductase